jgi:surface antigen
VEKIISREVSSSLPGIGLGVDSSSTTSKLKLPNRTPITQVRKPAHSHTLTPVGRAVLRTGEVATHVAVPRVLAHIGVIGAVAAVVLTGFTGHSAQLSPVADQMGYGSVLDQAASVDVAAQIAVQTSLLVTTEVNDTAKTLNSQANIATVDEGTLATSQVVDTAGNVAHETRTYQVKDGDTLSSVAANFNITTDTLRWANDLDENATLKPGQSLAILPISGLRYTVAAGDTAQSIAEKYQSNAEQIIAFNNAEVNGLQPGQAIIVPDGVMPQPVRPATPVASNTPARANSGNSSAASNPVRVAPGGPNSYSYGYCTWYVANRRAVPSFWGNANTWYGNAQVSGYGVGSIPRPGAIAWTGAGYAGHVAYVEGVSGDMVTISEMNYNGNWGHVTSRTVPASSFRYIY